LFRRRRGRDFPRRLVRPHGEETASHDRFLAHSALAIDDGWVLVGHARDNAAGTWHAAAYRVNRTARSCRFGAMPRRSTPFAGGVAGPAGPSRSSSHKTLGAVPERDHPVLPCPISAQARRWGDDVNIRRGFFRFVYLSGRRGAERLCCAGLPLVRLEWYRPTIQRILRDVGREFFGCRH